MGTLDFPNLCSHCGVDQCKLIDFLPFNCDRCNQVFCLQHKSYTKHLCPIINQIDVTVLICPLCAQRVHLRPNEDPNITWDLHVNCECDPSNHHNQTKKKFCPVAGCVETLAFSNTIRCKDCTLEHCLRHRFAHDHKCCGPNNSRIGFPFIGVLRSLNVRNSAMSLRASAEAGLHKLSVATNQALRKAKYGMKLGFGAGGELMEECMQCGARFANVNDLIEHVEKAHEHDVQTTCVVETIEVCPLCKRTFRDPVLLVEHVENHGNPTS